MHMRRMPAAAMSVSSDQPEPAQRLPQLPVGDPGGHDADPGVGRVDGGVVETVERGVLDGQRVAHLVDLALGVHGGRSQELAVGGVGVGRCRRSSAPVPRPWPGRGGRYRCRRRRRPRSSGWSTARWPSTGTRRGGPGPAPRRACPDTAPVSACRRGFPADDDGMVELLASGSSPAITTAPPHGVRSGEHAVAQGVAGPVHAGALAVEDAQNAVVAGVGAQGQASWDPITAVAACSSLMAGARTMGRSEASAIALVTSVS